MSHTLLASGAGTRARRVRPVLFLAAAAGLVIVYLLFFHDLGGVGLLGPDEPRYAAIGREMARSGDWVTPRLWGEPWFEKPALLYWMTGAGFSAGLGEELAPRLPVALLGAAFLAFYWWALRRSFGARAASFATAVLGTSAAWLAFTHVAVTDLPLTVFFSAAMLLQAGNRSLTVAARNKLLGRAPEQAAAAPLAPEAGETSEPARAVAAAALLGLAVLAKGLVPLVLALPFAWFARRAWRGWLRPAPVVAFAAVAAPWYVLCTAANGWPFLDDFFVRHHFARFANDSLQHEQPFWFYAPVLLAGLFPWTPAVALLCRRSFFGDERRRFLLAWVAFGFVFFSASRNKLPGYLLPLFPALCALIGIALAEAKRARGPLAACGALLCALPVIGALLPQALLRGITHASVPALIGPSFSLLALAALVWWLDSRGRRSVAVASLVVAMAAAVVWLERATFPVLDRTVSARQAWRDIAARSGEVCVDRANRSWGYNLNYYSGKPLPDCASEPRRYRLTQGSGQVTITDTR